MEHTTIRKAVCAAFAGAALTSGTAWADETADLKAEIAAQRARIDALERKLDAATSAMQQRNVSSDNAAPQTGNSQQQPQPGQGQPRSTGPALAGPAITTDPNAPQTGTSQQPVQPGEGLSQRNVPSNYQAATNLTALGVTLYGRVHLSYEAVRIGAPTAAEHWQLQNNTSRLGVKGERDVGSDTTAFFQIESGVAADDPNNATVGGSNVLGGRETFVGIRNARIGEAKVGNFYQPYDDLHSISGNYFQLFTGTSNDATLWANGASAATGGFDQRFANDAAYYTPVVAGFQGKLYYSLVNGAGGRETLGGNGARAVSASIAYDQGPLKAAWGFEQIADARTYSTNFYERGTSNFVTAGYTLGPFYLAGLAEHDRLTNLNGTGRDRTRNYFHLLGKYTIGAHTVGAFGGKAYDWKGAAAIDHSGATMWTVGYNYQLFKDTGLYVLYTKLNDESAAGYILGGSPQRAAGAINWTPALGNQHGAVGGMFFIF